MIENEARRIVPMILQPGQIRLRDAFATQRNDGRPVRIIYLKSRRIMATTGTAAHFFHDTFLAAGVHTVVMAHTDDSVKEIFPHYKRFHDEYIPLGIDEGPFHPGDESDAYKMPPTRVFSDRIFFEHGGDVESSYIKIHTAGSVDFGRGTRFTNVHFSEFPYYANPAATLAAVMSCVPALPETSAVIEGTAKSIGDAFQRMCVEAMERRSEWLFLFMGWWEHPLNRMPLAVGPDRFQESLSAEERELKGRFSLDLEQLAWRRWKLSSEFNGDAQRFRREHPATPEEAFSASSRNRFSIPHIQRQPIVRDPVEGELIMNDIGAGEQRIVFMPTPGGATRIWRRPEKGRAYALGADCAQGLDINNGEGDADPDWSVGEVLDRDTGEQCAVFRARVMPGETGRSIARLGRYYNLAQICGERNPGGGGVSMLEAILNTDYPSSMIYHRPVAPDRDPQVRGDRIGWDTSGVSRPILISALDEALRQMAILIHDATTQRELLTFVIKPNGKAEHDIGCHDDCVIALALALVVIEKMPRPRLPDAPLFPKLAKYGRPSGERPDERGHIVRVVR